MTSTLRLSANRASAFVYRTFCGMLVVLSVAAGCASSSQPTTQPGSWSEQALRDPAGFDPKMEKIDVSGGGLMDLDRKEMGRDVDHVLNP